ncbi:MAG: hypothetical protein VB050_03260 [Geobacteraceae bacterium]|nr:hypothetical protein [Geobacteraceae bacterium]
MRSLTRITFVAVLTLGVFLHPSAFTLHPSTAIAAVTAPDNELPNDGRSTMQTAIRKKKFQQVPFALSAASKVFRFKGTPQAGEIDLRGAIGAIIRTTSGNLSCWYDADTTLTWTLDGGVEHEIVADPDASTITCNGTDTAIQAGGF